MIMWVTDWITYCLFFNTSSLLFRLFYTIGDGQLKDNLGNMFNEYSFKVRAGL